MTSPFLLCFGLGFSARALVAQLAPLGWRIAGTTRSPERAAALREEGIEGLTFARGSSLGPIRRLLPEVTHLLSSIPPDEPGDPVVDALGEAIAAAPRLDWCGYLSTTGVYGDRGGGLVTEDSALAPTSERSRRRVAAEEAWLRVHREQRLPLHLFRLAGIYGPGRNSLLAVLEGSAKRIDKPGHIFSRIHVEDVAQVLRASMARPNPGAIYNLADDEPAPQAEVVAFACRLLGRDPPPLQSLEEAGLSPLARSFYRDSKRVSNRRIKEELGVVLRYPDYRQGLTALSRML